MGAYGSPDLIGNNNQSINSNMIYCKVCGKEVAKSAKACPNCGAKVSQPIYKKWWFWLLIFLLFLYILGASSTPTSYPTYYQSSSISQNSYSPSNAVQQDIPIDSSTIGERNALSKAKQYLNYTAFSYKGLIEQLEFEGFSNSEATYGADNCDADWNEQAARKAKQYMNYTSFSKKGLIEQLEFEGFTSSQAEYGVKAVGY